MLYMLLQGDNGSIGVASPGEENEGSLINIFYAKVKRFPGNFMNNHDLSQTAVLFTMLRYKSYFQN